MFNSAQQTSSLQQAIPQLQGVYVGGGFVTGIIDLSGTTIRSLSNTPLVKNFVQRATAASVTSTNALTLGWQPRAWLPINVTGGLQTIQRTDQTYIPYGITPAGPDACDRADLDCPCGYHWLLRFGQRTFAQSDADSWDCYSTLPPACVVGAWVVTCIAERRTISRLPLTSSLQEYLTLHRSSVSVVSNICGSAGQSSSGSSTYGWYFEPRLNLSSRFFAAPGFRLDGGSGGTHATSSSGGVVGGLSAFPKLDLSYVAVDHQGSRPLWGFLTLLRPRVAFGLAGTQPAPEDRLRLFNVGMTVLTHSIQVVKGI